MMELITFPVDGAAVGQYFDRLVGRFFKILPMYESGEGSISVYLRSLQMELSGLNRIMELENGDNLLSLVAILESLRGEDVTKDDVKREVFRAIKICNVMQAQYGEGAVC